jgi:hypothetical protein
VHIRADHPSAESLRGSGRLGRCRAEIAGYDAGEVLRRVEELRRSAEPEAAEDCMAGG